MSTEPIEQAQFLPLTEGPAARANENDTSGVPLDVKERASDDAPVVVASKHAEELGQDQIHANGGPIVQKDYGGDDEEAHALVPLNEHVEGDVAQVSSSLFFAWTGRIIHTPTHVIARLILTLVVLLYLAHGRPCHILCQPYRRRTQHPYPSPSSY